MSEQPPFAVDSTAIAAKVCVGADDAVARDHDRDGVGTVGEADGADRLGISELFRDIEIRDGFAVGDRLQIAPDA